MKTISSSQSVGVLGISSLGTAKRMTSSEHLLAKARRLLIKGADQLYDDKDELYLMRLNTVLLSTIQEIETEVNRKQAMMNKLNSSQVTQAMRPVTNTKKENEEVQSEISQNDQVLKYYRKQLSDLESKRNRLLDSKYRQEINEEVNQLTMQIKDLNMFCTVNRERLKRRRVKPAEMNQSIVKTKASKLPGPNEPKAPKSKPASNKPSIVAKPVAQTSVQEKQVNLLEKYNQEEVTIKDLEMNDPRQLIEKGRQVCEELDLHVQRNARLSDKLENIQMLTRRLSLKLLKVDERYEQLREYARDNHICEQPGMEGQHKQLIQRIATLEKNLIVNKNLYEIKVDEAKQHNEQVLQLCESRGAMCTKIKQEVVALRAQIVEMRAIQDSLTINEYIPLRSHKTRNNQILNFHGDYAEMQSTQPLNNSFVMNKSLLESALENDDQQHHRTEKKVAAQYVTTMLDDIFNAYNFDLPKDEQERRVKIAEALFKGYDGVVSQQKGVTIIVREEAQHLLEKTILEVLDQKIEISEALASKWVNEFDSDKDGKLSLAEYKNFLLDDLEDWLEENK